MRKKATRSNGHGKYFVEPMTVPVVEDDLDAVKLISAILGQFAPDDQSRIIRWVKEKFGLDDAINNPPLIVPPSSVAGIPSRHLLRNPHTMPRPPLNKVFIQDDDDEGELVGIPADRDVPEPPEAEILKPVKESRKLVVVTDIHKAKDGTIVTSESVVSK